MKILGPTPFPRLNEAGGLLLLFLALFLTLSLVSYHPSDPSWNTAAGAMPAANLTGTVGSHLADLLLQALGLPSFLLPFFLVALGWKWVRSRGVTHPWLRIAGAFSLLLAAAALLALVPDWKLYGGVIAPGGVAGMLLAGALVSVLNLAGTLLALTAWLLVSLYLLSSFSFAHTAEAIAQARRPAGWLRGRLSGFRLRLRRESEEVPEDRVRERAEKMARVFQPAGAVEDEAAEPEEAYREEDAEIPIHTLEDMPPPPSPEPDPLEGAGAAGEAHEEGAAAVGRRADRPEEYRLPPTDFLNEPPLRNPYDEEELKAIAAAIRSKFEEFNIRGAVVQINHGPVVTTFEFKPEPGIKYSRITSLTDDLCLGLEAESILIERIPGKPTVGIEVPNRKREIISLRQVIESEEFRKLKSRLPVPLGKDINGRIRVTALEKMPHLLIAGSTGSGKSVMLNSTLMATLYRATPDEVRMILVDPKRVELGIYEDIPHLLTPVITDPRKATNALRNAVLEMERRYKLLAALSVRNLEQYNRKVRRLLDERRTITPEAQEAGWDELRPLPYILIVIDELADLMMVERANVETSVARLSQMARAVGVHLVLATQRPSVDVITGLIKNNLPARISFRVATRFDSRTIIDTMGAERLLGKGDMLFLPPGSSRLIRMHGAFVSEEEITSVVEFWKEQARPEYDETFLMAPPEDGEAGEGGEDVDRDDPLYEQAVRVVLEMGKASTSILQRRLRIGYGRAARLLDIMQKEGIIGPPDGSRPREVLKAPDWLEEVERQLR